MDFGISIIGFIWSVYGVGTFLRGSHITGGFNDFK